MCNQEDRIGTFPKPWYDKERPTQREMVGVGFYCIVLATLLVVFIAADDYFTEKKSVVRA